MDVALGPFRRLITREAVGILVGCVAPGSLAGQPAGPPGCLVGSLVESRGADSWVPRWIGGVSMIHDLVAFRIDLMGNLKLVSINKLLPNCTYYIYPHISGTFGFKHEMDSNSTDPN